MNKTLRPFIVALLVALVLTAAFGGVALAADNGGGYPEVPAGNQPQPNPGGGGGGGGGGVDCNTATSACPEVPAGQQPQPNP